MNWPEASAVFAVLFFTSGPFHGAERLCRVVRERRLDHLDKAVELNKVKLQIIKTEVETIRLKLIIKQMEQGSDTPWYRQ